MDMVEMTKSNTSNVCPRCNRPCLNKDRALNSIAHLNHNIQICSKCGEMEGLTKLGAEVRQSEVYLTIEFETMLRHTGQVP